MEIVFATNNQHKILEVTKILPSTFELRTLKDIGCHEEIPETAATLEGNSFQKANFIYTKYGKNCIADDTGLEVTALNGAPGVRSARYAGEPSNPAKNIEKILQELKDKTVRTAQFRTIFTLILNGNIYQFEGTVKGKIINSPRGEGGFGYDPVFVPKNYTQTFAELPLEVKNKISHRGLATKKLIDFLSKY